MKLFHGRVNAHVHDDRDRDHENGRGRDALSILSVNDLLHSKEVVLTMYKCGTEKIQTKANAANDQDKHRIIDSCVSVRIGWLQGHAF